MAIGVSIFLIAVGAILGFAVDARPDGVDLDAVGIILMIVGFLGLLLSLVLWDEWRPTRREVVHEPDVVERHVFH